MSSTGMSLVTLTDIHLNPETHTNMFIHTHTQKYTVGKKITFISKICPLTRLCIHVISVVGCSPGGAERTSFSCLLF